MENGSREKIVFLSILVVLLVIVVVAGGTYAYFEFGINGTGSNIGGSAYKFDIDMDVEVIKEASSLVPLSDNLVVTAISKNTNKCVDNGKGYDICSLYKLSLSNNGNADEELYGYVSTGNTTYESNHLKYQIFTLSNGTYTAVTDPTSVSLTQNEKVYFLKNSQKIISNLDMGESNEYYLVMWISLIEDEQNEDAGKVFGGKIGFESLRGNVISADFGQ